jgi:hypothetical protein
MKVKTLVKWLQECDQDSQVALSRLYIIASKEEPTGDYEVILDSPIVGLARSNPDIPKKQREVRFLVAKDMENKRLKKFMNMHFGKIQRMR